MATIGHFNKYVSENQNKTQIIERPTFVHVEKEITVDKPVYKVEDVYEVVKKPVFKVEEEVESVHAELGEFIKASVGTHLEEALQISNDVTNALDKELKNYFGFLPSYNPPKTSSTQYHIMYAIGAIIIALQLYSLYKGH